MKAFRKVSHVFLAFALAAAAGCQSDSPTEPSGGGGSISPQPPPQTVTYTVTVAANPPQLAAGSTTPTSITVQVRRQDNGAAPPDLTGVTLTTNLGEFGQSGSGQRTVQLQLVNGQAQAVLYPGTSAGTATVRATVDNTNNAGAVNVQIGQADTFFVGAVAPSVGNPQGGEEVTITGGGFDGPVRVTFNGTSAQVLSVSPTRIRVRTPSAIAAGVNVGVGQAQPVPVGVTINVNEANSQSDTLANGFVYSLGTSTQQPSVFSVDPSSGTNDGGTRVVIVGDGFQSPVQVFFGQGTVDNFSGVQATIESVTQTRIVAVTPAARGFGINNVNQLVDILVRNSNSGFATVASDRFQYGADVRITAVGPSSGPYTGGTRVTLQGQGFDEPVAVSLNGVGQRVISVSGTQIVVETVGVLVNQCPANGQVTETGWSVVNIETGAGATFAGGFIYIVPRPIVTGINPASGNPGTTTATITGQGFSSNVQVLFGDSTNGAAAQILSNNGSSISIRVPSVPPGFTFNTQPCDGNGDGNPGGTQAIPTPISVTVRNLDGPGCSGTLSNAFTLNPPSTTCTGDTTTPTTFQCSDGVDNDGDGRIDFNANPAVGDPQCTGPTDNSEST